MITDKKQIIPLEYDSAPNIQITPPLVSKRDIKYHHYNSQTDCDLTHNHLELKQKEEIDNNNFQILPHNNNTLKSLDDSEIVESCPNDCKQEKNVYQMSTFLSLPMKTKEKLSYNEDTFQAPQLTAQSVMSSEQLDMDSESNGNQLPISSASRYKIHRVFHQQSQGSDDMMEHYQYHRIYHMYPESKESDPSESDDIMTICQHCTSLFDKCKRLQAENGEYIKQNLNLADQLAKYEESSKRELIDGPPNDPPLIKELFLFQIEQSYKTLLKVNQLLAEYVIDFPEKDCEYLEKFCIQYKKIQENVLGRELKQDRKQVIDRIHANYKKLIGKLIRSFEQKEAKRDSDFKKFINLLSDKRQFQHKLHLPVQKHDRHRRKSKTFTQKQQASDQDFLRLLLQQSRQKIQWLELNCQREKERNRYLERSFREQNQKLTQQITDLTKQKIINKNQIAKCSKDLADFINQLTKSQSKSLTESEFFKTLCQRIFEISNCIPFEDNDQQNLFAPENQTQLYEMIERIRKFYVKFQSYNVSRDNHYENEKSLFTQFLKQLVDQSKVSQPYMIDMLGRKQYESLSFIKQLLRSSRSKPKRHSLIRDSNHRRFSMRIEQSHSFIFENDRII